MQIHVALANLGGSVVIWVNKLELIKRKREIIVSDKDRKDRI